MKSLAKKREGYIRSAKMFLHDAQAKKRNTDDIDLDLVARCVDAAIPQVSYIHVPRRAAKLYRESKPFADCRTIIYQHSCGKCGVYIGTSGMEAKDDNANFDCEDCGENYNKLEAVYSIY